MNRKIEKNLIDNVIKCYCVDLLGSDAISKKYNMGKKTVLKILKNNNIFLRNKGRQYIGGIKEANKRYSNKPEIKERKKNISKSWSEKNREHLREYHRKWREQNKEQWLETKRNYEKNRKHNDPIYKLIANFRTAIYTVLKENKMDKNGHYFEILGYSPEDLKKCLEQQFIDNMSWENYGKWHIDHKTPITFFHFTSIYDEEFKKCWSLDNLQPMWGDENIRKSNKIL